MSCIVRVTADGVGYNGQLHEPNTRLQVLGNGARAFSPVSMRFLSPDDLSPFASGGINAYAYCACDPVNNVDPSGRFAVQMAAALMTVGALAMGGAAVASEATGNEKFAALFGVIAGGLAAGMVAVALPASISRYAGLKQGQLRIYRRGGGDVVDVHGAPYRTRVGSVGLDGTELAELLKSKGVGKRPITLLSCNGADGRDAQARVLANATGQPVTSFVGPVYVNGFKREVALGTSVVFLPERGIYKAASAIRNREMNQRTRGPGMQHIPRATRRPRSPSHS